MDREFPADADFEQRVRASFARQRLMRALNGQIAFIAPGELHIEAPFDKRFTQQDSFLHAGIVTTLMETACGHAAFTLMPSDSRVATVELKVNFLNPAWGERFRAEGRVVKTGRTVSVCKGKLIAFQNDQESPVAIMQATVICIRKDS